MRITLKQESALVFDPTSMLEDVELGEWKFKVPADVVLMRQGDSAQEQQAIFNDHELTIYRLVREVLALRERVVALEERTSALEGAAVEPVDFAALASAETRP